MKQKNWFLLTVIIIASLLTCLYFYKKTSEHVVSNVKMRKFIHNKLWRDKGPIRMEATGAIIHVKELDDEQYKHQLGLKLKEEADEVHTAGTPEELKYEIADVLEVLDCIIKAHNFSRDEIIACQKEKRDERGSFLDRKFVTVSEYLPGSFGEQYTLKDLRCVEIID